jgi:phage FluMu protein gp41
MAAVERFTKITGGLPGSKEDIGKLRTLLEQRSAQAAEYAKTAKERNIIGLLANIAANPSQYSSVAIGAGTAKSLPEFAAAEAAQRKQQMEDAMAGLSLTKAEREEAMANITGGMGLYKTELEEMGREYTADARIRAARIAAGKAHQNEMSQWMDAHVAAERERIANGERKPVSDAILRQEAGLALFKTRQQPQMAAVAQRDVEAAGTLDARLKAIEESGLNRATDAVTAATNNLRTVEGREMKRIGKVQGPAAALQYKNQLIRDLAAGKITLSTPGSAASTQAPATAPKAAGSSTLSAVDQKALEWANANPKDPRAAQIKARLGIR